MTRNAADGRTLDDSLRTSEAFRLLVESVKDYAILMLDTEGRVTSWNEGAQRIKGYTADEILGRSFTEFYPEESVAARFPQYELETAAREGRFEDEGWRKRKDGSRFWANVVITALRNDAGELIGFAKVTRDLTARRETEEQARRLVAEEAARTEAARRAEELALLNEQLEEQAAELEMQTEELTDQAERLRRTNQELQAALSDAERTREVAELATAAMTEAYGELDQFAYVASHDLKAPLRGISNLAQWIQDDLGEQLTGESVEHMRLLQGRVRRMASLIEGILVYSRAGRNMKEPVPVDTGVLVREVIELLAAPANVTVQIADGLPTIPAERVPLQQVFLNLLGNAVKYAGAVRPDAAVQLEWRQSGEHIQFTVHDNGPGIAPEFHERVWGLFQTLEARDKVEGTGIGLSVVKKIVETRGGRVWLDSSPGQGAAFHFTWPATFRQGTPK